MYGKGQVGGSPQMASGIPRMLNQAPSMTAIFPAAAVIHQ